LWDAESPKWWLCRTKARQEKVVARQLLARKVPFYLPLVRKTSLTRGRPRVALLPLFAGYVFLYGSQSSRSAALQTNRVAQLLPVRQGAQLRRDLLQVSKLIAHEAPIMPYEKLAIGDPVRVKSGIFAGLEGTVIRRHGKTQLAIAVNCLQKGALLEIKDYMLEPI
jgi:transcription antitermination factor NusG